MVLQNIIFPALQSVIPEELYFRALNEKVELFRAAPETLSFHAGGLPLIHILIALPLSGGVNSAPLRT